MEIVLIKESNSTSSDILTQVKNNIIGRIQQAVNVIDKNKTQSLILPIVPKGIKLPTSTSIENYEGIEQPYSLPKYKNLEKISWASFFPHQKAYNFMHKGSSSNAYEYVEFLTERLENELPLRLLAYEYPKNIASVVSDIANRSIKILYDDFVLVEKFEWSVDNVGDLPYTLSLNEFNSDIVSPKADFNDFKRIFSSGAVNEISRYALKLTGLI